jgi:DnaA family protein
MQQLPLEISPAADPDFASFLAGANGEALARVRDLAAGALREAIVYLWGEPGSGRSHLLRAAARAHAGLVVADDVERLDAAGQQALFAAINAAREGHGAVLAAGSAPPAALPLRLTRFPRDLASLRGALEVLDRYSLIKQRALTLPLAREALAATQQSPELPRQTRGR